MVGDLLKTIAKGVLPGDVRRWLRDQASAYRMMHWPRLRRITPISRNCGFDRGKPIDRYYIERFISAHTSDIKGHILEFGHDGYTRKFGGNRVIKSDVLNLVRLNEKTTIVADLTCADHIPSDTFDCIICTQTLQMIYDVRAAIRHLCRILKPGGVLLATSHGTSKIFRREGIDPWGEYWRFTSQASRRMFTEMFPAKNINIEVYGNVISAVAFLHGLATEELRKQELDYFDPEYEVLIAVRAVKP